MPGGGFGGSGGCPDLVQPQAMSSARMQIRRMSVFKQWSPSMVVGCGKIGGDEGGHHGVVLLEGV
jgi:hypothetical protein